MPRASVTRQRQAGVNLNKNTQNEKVRHHIARYRHHHRRRIRAVEMPILQRHRLERPVRLSLLPRNRKAVEKAVVSLCPYPHPMKRSSHEHSRVDLIRASVARGGKYSPASRLCQYRVLSPVFSAICSCVNLAPTRIAATFFPKRERRRQGAGFFDGMPVIVAKMENRKHEALPRYSCGCIPIKIQQPSVAGTCFDSRQQSFKNTKS